MLPEELLNSSDRLRSVLISYGLPENFNINDYENWIPAHPYCNQRKSDSDYEGLPLIKTILDSCASNKELEQRIEFKLNREPQKAELMAKIQAAIDINLVNLRELQEFVLKTDIMDSEDEDLKRIGKELNQRIEYQAEKMIKGIMVMVRSQTIDVINSICSALGRDWQLGRSMIIIPHKLDKAHTVRYWLQNNVDHKMSVNIVVIPEIINNVLLIQFRKNDEIFDEILFNMNEGINWEHFRNELKGHYKRFLSDKLGR
ncbi:hypothetical protein [Rufibacter psychrotolerans]|uniref:hypothetical protein n=1 Tax=Rufibacter psychrotolerans TaxID=2812556 RepID=UPI001967B223|nr:hypothetical protein [Rufibacter sp. SYSU D00308]